MRVPNKQIQPGWVHPLEPNTKSKQTQYKHAELCSRNICQAGAYFLPWLHLVDI